MKRLVKSLTVVTFSVAATLRVGVTAFAATSSGIKIDNLDGTPATVGEIIPNITNTLLTAAGIIAVIMIIVGGLMYSLSAGDSKKAGTAKDTILYAVIGLVITLLASAIVNFVLGRF